MKHRILFIALLASALLIGFNAGGCASILPGNDPVVVNSERTTAIAFDAVDGFLKFDDQNREVLRERVPAVHNLAESLRTSAPEKFRDARRLLKIYESTSDTADGQAAQDAVATVEELARQARLALIQAQAATTRSN